MILLGEWDTSKFSNGPHTVLLYTFFTGSTFISQIIMLNMLIAIMGDTFDHMIENREVNATKTKLKLITECIPKKNFLANVEAENDFMVIV